MTILYKQKEKKGEKTDLGRLGLKDISEKPVLSVTN